MKHFVLAQVQRKNVTYVSGIDKDDDGSCPHSTNLFSLTRIKNGIFLRTKKSIQTLPMNSLSAIKDPIRSTPKVLMKL
ncbi:MAG TPA: hypothetical protein VMW10_12820 [Alphaproteobacteria bacterium]|nr:hypothetical protein [Alphaproteobacteria bacterium]